MAGDDLEAFARGERLSHDKLNRYRDALLRLLNLRGDEFVQVQHTSAGPTLHLALRPLLGRMPKLGRFWAQITASAVADTPARNRWVYAFSEIEKTAGGYAGWETVSDGRSGTTTDDPARNALEQMNVASGLCGNGVDTSGADFPAGFAIQPAPINAIVEMREVVLTSTGDIEYWFAYANGIDGTCE